MSAVLYRICTGSDSRQRQKQAGGRQISALPRPRQRRVPNELFPGPQPCVLRRVASMSTGGSLSRAAHDRKPGPPEDAPGKRRAYQEGGKRGRMASHQHYSLPTSCDNARRHTVFSVLRRYARKIVPAVGDSGQNKAARPRSCGLAAHSEVSADRRGRTEWSPEPPSYIVAYACSAARLLRGCENYALLTFRIQQE